MQSAQTRPRRPIPACGKLPAMRRTPLGEGDDAGHGNPFLARRQILAALLLSLAAPLIAKAQPAGKTFRLGLLATNRPTGTPPAGAGSGETLVVALNELGYIEGRNIVIERRYSEGITGRLPGLATELVGLRPDVLYAHGGAQCAALH